MISAAKAGRRLLPAGVLPVAVELSQSDALEQIERVLADEPGLDILINNAAFVGTDRNNFV